MNLQTPHGGSTVSTASDNPASDGIQAYPSPADFVAAFPLEMNNGSYPAIVAALKAGTGMEGSAATPEIASELSIYSGGGYNSIPAGEKIFNCGVTGRSRTGGNRRAPGWLSDLAS